MTVDTGAFTRFEQDGWSRAAQGYHRFITPVTGQVAEPLLDAAHVGAGDAVLDVATDPGDLAARAAARGASVVGVDIAEQVVALAARLNPGCEFRTADATDLPFADATFTAVVANFLLPHLADHHRATAEMARVLAPGGWLAVSIWDVPERAAVLGIVVAAVAEAGAIPPVHLPPVFGYSADEALIGLLSGAGLDQVEVQSGVHPPRRLGRRAVGRGAGGDRAHLCAGREPGTGDATPHPGRLRPARRRIHRPRRPGAASVGEGRVGAPVT